MANAIKNIDHCLIACADLHVAAEIYQHIGFTLTPEGRHKNRDTANYCIMFPNDYMELLGIVDKDGPPGPFSKWIETNSAGLMGFAMAPVDDQNAVDWFKSQGLHPKLTDLSRAVEADGEVRNLRFKNVTLSDDDTPVFRTFACHHLTPDLMRTPAWLTHANGARGLNSVAILVKDVDAAAAQFNAIMGPSALTWTGRTLTLGIGRHRALFAGTDDFAVLYGEIDDLDFKTGLGAISIPVDDLDITADYFDRAGVPFIETEDTLLLSPGDTGGVIFEFVADQD